MGGGSLGKSESSASQGAQFGQDVFGPQAGALSGLYGSLANLFGQTNNQMQQQIPGAVGQQQAIYEGAMPAWQQQMQGGAFQGMPLQQQYADALLGGGAEQDINQMIMGGAGNNYAQAMKDQLAGDAIDRMGRGLASIDSRASAAGQPGSSRHGLVQSDLIRNEMDRLGEQQTNIGYNTFDKDLERKLGIAQRADQFDLGRLQSAQNMLGAQQGAMAGGLGASGAMQGLGMGQFNPSMAPWQAAQGYAQGIGAPTVLSSGSSSMDSDSKSMGGSGYSGKSK